MAVGYDYANINLASPWGSPGESLDQAIALKQRQKERADAMYMQKEEWDYRKAQDELRRQEKNEMDVYRKTQLLRDLTDISKYQTGNDIADAIGNTKANEVISKWTAELSKNKDLSPSDLLSGVNKDMATIYSGLNAMKTELNQGDEAVKLLKSKFPNLDVNSLIQNQRADVLQRRIDQRNEFINPLQVKPSELSSKLSDPEYLSQYIIGAPTLRKAIQEPKGAEKAAVFVGSPMENVRFEAQIPFFKRPTFKPEDVQGGFLKRGVQPKLQFRASTLPAEALPSSSNKPFNVVDEDVYTSFLSDPQTNIELIASARKKYPNYDNFNTVEKEYAKRNVLYDELVSLDQSDFFPTASTRAPVSMTKINLGGEKEGINVRNLYDNIEKEINKREELEAKDGKRRATPLSVLNVEEQKLIINSLKPLLGEDVDQSTVMLDKDESTGRTAIYKVAEGTTNQRGNKVGFLDELSINVPAQVGVKEKREAVKQAQGKTYNYKGKTYTESQLEAAAKQSGMTLSEYKKALNL